MAVIVDATGTQLITTVAGASVNYTGITVGSGANRALVVTVACAAAVTAPNAHWDTAGTNQAMTLITTVRTQTNVTTFMFGLRNPTAGLKTLNVAWTTSAKSNIEAISFTGVETTSDALAFINTNGAQDGGTVASVTTGLISPANSIAVASYATTATFSTINQTNIFTDTTNTGCEGAASRANGAGANILFTGSDTTTTGNKVIAGFVVAPPPPVLPPPLQEPVRSKIARVFAIALMASGLFSAPLPPKEDIPRLEWTTSWQDPVRAKKGLAAHEQQFLAWSPGLTKEDIPKVDRWFAPWREPAKLSKMGLAVHQQQSAALLQLTPTATVIEDWPDFARRAPPLPQQPNQSFTPPQVTAAPTWTTWTPWPDLVPTRRKPVVDFQPWTFLEPAPQVWFPYDRWPDTAPAAKRVAQNPDWSYGTFVTPAFIPTYTQWTQWPDFATKTKRVVDFIPWTFLEPAPQVWFPPNVTPDFAPAAKRTIEFPFLAFVAPQPPWNAWTNWPDLVPTRKKPATDFIPWTFIPPPAQVFFPCGSWDDFARKKPQPLDTQPLIWSTFTPAPPFFLVPDRWPDFATKKRPPLNYDPLAFLQTVRSPFNSFVNWPDFATKKRPPLNYNPLAFLQTVRTPWNTMTTWPDFAPIRGKIGLHPAQQQFTARFAGAFFAGTASITMSAFEVNTDGAAAAILVVQSQPAVDAAVSIQEIGILGGSVTP